MLLGRRDESTSGETLVPPSAAKPYSLEIYLKKVLQIYNSRIFQSFAVPEAHDKVEI